MTSANESTDVHDLGVDPTSVPPPSASSGSKPSDPGSGAPPQLLSDPPPAIASLPDAGSTSEADEAALSASGLDTATGARAELSAPAAEQASAPIVPDQRHEDLVPMADSEEADGAHDGELASPIAEVVAALTRVERGLEEYERLLTRQTEVASRLHSENQELKKGELRQAQTSLILGVIRVLDDVSRMSETAEEAARSDLLLIGESLTDTLERYGVERLHVSPGDCFDGKAHKIAQVAPTGDEGMSRTVAGVTRPGFAWVDGTVIRVADVVVYKFVPGHESAAEADSQGRPEDPVRDAAPGPREPRA